MRGAEFCRVEGLCGRRRAGKAFARAADHLGLSPLCAEPRPSANSKPGFRRWPAPQPHNSELWRRRRLGPRLYEAHRTDDPGDGLPPFGPRRWPPRAERAGNAGASTRWAMAAKKVIAPAPSAGFSPGRNPDIVLDIVQSMMACANIVAGRFGRPAFRRG